MIQIKVKSYFCLQQTYKGMMELAETRQYIIVSLNDFIYTSWEKVDKDESVHLSFKGKSLPNVKVFMSFE